MPSRLTAACIHNIVVYPCSTNNARRCYTPHSPTLSKPAGLRRLLDLFLHDMRVNPLLLLQLRQRQILGALDLTQAVLHTHHNISVPASEEEWETLRTDSPQAQVNGAPMSHSVEG